MRTPRRDLATNLGRGLLMGGADIIPGVSGGTVALVVGIYERLVTSIRAGAAVPVALARGGPTAARERAREVEWRLVLPLGVGILTAIGIGAVVILPLREAYPEQMRAVFLGLVGASVMVPWQRIRSRTPATLAVMLAAVALAFALVGLPPREIADPSLPRVTASAAFAICAMILPGVSGAFLLEALGVYNATLAALSGLDVAYVGAFTAGAVVGLGLFAKLLETLLDRWHDLTMAALTGLMIGALRALWPWLTEDRGLLAPPGEASALVPALLAVAAFLGLRLLLRTGDRRPQADDLTT